MEALCLSARDHESPAAYQAANDTLRKVLGDDWERVHWYATEAERDAAFDTMAERHGYYRKTDTPTQILEKISR